MAVPKGIEEVKELLKRYKTTPRTEDQYAKLQKAIAAVAREKAKMEREQQEWEIKKERLAAQRSKLRQDVQELAEKHAQRMDEEEKRTFRKCHACEHFQSEMRKLKEDGNRKAANMRRSASLSSTRLCSPMDALLPWVRAVPK